MLALATHSTGRANDDHRNTISLAAKKAALRSTRTPAAGKTAQSMLSQGAMLHSHSGLAHRVAEFDAAVGQSAAVNAEVKIAAAKGLVQEISAGSKAALMHNVRTKLATSVLKSATAGTPTSATSENAAGKALASDKIQLRMFMESRCPGCRETATTWLKEVLDAPGMSDIVDFKAVSWGWAFVEEAPTQEMAAHNITHGSRCSRMMLYYCFTAVLLLYYCFTASLLLTKGNLAESTQRQRSSLSCRSSVHRTQGVLAATRSPSPFLASTAGANAWATRWRHAFKTCSRTTPNSCQSLTASRAEAAQVTCFPIAKVLALPVQKYKY